MTEIPDDEPAPGNEATPGGDPVRPESPAPGSNGDVNPRVSRSFDPVTPAPSTRDRRLPHELWILIGAAFVIAIGYGLIAPILPQFANTFAITYWSSGVVVAVFAVFRLLWAAPTGILVQRIGERTVYMTGVVIVAAASAATAFAQNLWQLLAFRALGGIGSVMFTIAAVGLLVRLSPAHMRGKVSAMYAATFLIGNIAGPVLGGFLAEISIQTPFLVYAAALVVAAILIGTFLPKPPEHDGATNSLPPLTVAEAWRDRAYRSSLVSGFANGWVNFGVRISVVPLFVAAALSSSPSAAGVVMAAFALGNAAMLPFSSRYADAVGRRPLILVGTVVAGLLTCAFGLAPNLVVLIVLSVIAGAGVGAMNPAQQAVIADVIGSQRSAGTVISTYQMVVDVGAILGPVLGGLIADTLGFEWAFALTGLIMLISVLPWLRTDDTLHRAAA